MVDEAKPKRKRTLRTHLIVPDRLVVAQQLQGDEAALFFQIFREIERRHDKATKSAVLRELNGRDAPRFTTPEHRRQWDRLPVLSAADRPKAGYPQGKSRTAAPSS